mmetsp:Transcript_3535/g.8514  ORF Transcript_3535/g.8514 Transcript_3535/m.8514 type:complete len:173 (+) Transcript_3535:100-618(+)
MGKKRAKPAEEDQLNSSSTARQSEVPADSADVVQDPRMKKLVKRYRLDKAAESKLCEVLAKWDEDKQYRYYKDLWKVLADAVKPSATVMIIVKKIVAGERLCEESSSDTEDPNPRQKKNPRNIPAGSFKPQRGMGVNGRIAARAMHEGAQRIRQELQANLIQQMRSQMGGDT